MLRLHSGRTDLATLGWTGLSVVAALAAVLLYVRARHDIFPTQARSSVFLGYEYQAVYVAQSRCAGCNHPKLPEAVQDIMFTLEQEATTVSQSFSSVAVALDADPRAGFRFLGRFGTFDEYALGGGWQNTYSQILDRLDGNLRRGTPAIYLNRRRVRMGYDGQQLRDKDTIITALLGATAILNYYEQLKSQRISGLADQVIGRSLNDQNAPGESQ